MAINCTILGKPALLPQDHRHVIPGKLPLRRRHLLRRRRTADRSPQLQLLDLPPQGAVAVVLSLAAFTLRSGEDQLSAYTFNQHRIRHQFCRVCGAQPFAYGTAPDGAAMCAVNLRCVPDVALDALQIHSYDGASV